MARKRRKSNNTSASESDLTDRQVSRDDTESRDPPSRSRRQREVAPGSSRLKWLGIGLIGLLVIVFFSPMIVATSPLRQWVIDRALGDFNGSATVQSVSLGWFSPVQIEGLSVVDHQGEPLLSVESLTSTKSLLSLINGTDYGRFDMRQPEIHYKTHADGSNLEDAVAAWLEPSQEDSATKPMELVIQDGILHVAHDRDSRTWQLSQLAGGIALFGDVAPMTARVEGVATNGAGETGSFQLTGVFDQGTPELSFADGKVALSGVALPLDVASVFATRYVEPLDVAGVLDGGLEVSWTQYGSTLSMKANAAKVRRFVGVAPQRLGGDQIQLAQLEVQGELSLNEKMVVAKEFVCQTDVGSLRSNGEISWEQWSDEQIGEPASEAGFQADGRLDLARLAAMLPETISIQQGLVIESGELQLMTSSRMEGSSRRWVFNVESAGVSAIRDGRRINWHKPIRVVASGREGLAGLQLESLDCQTNFLSFHGQGTVQQGEFTMQGDLAKALGEIEQFIDLGGLRVRGVVDGRFVWQTDPVAASGVAQQPFRLDGRVNIEDPQWERPGQAKWQQPRLSLIVSGSGQVAQAAGSARLSRLESGRIQLLAGQEQLTAQLTEPIVNPSWQTPWKLQCNLSGDLQQWLAQLSTFFPIDFVARGQIKATAQVVASPQWIQVPSLRYECQSFDFAGFGTTIREPMVTGEGSVAYEMATGRLQADQLTVVSNAFSASGQQVVFDVGKGELQGDVAFRADVNRVYPWWMGVPAPDAIHWYGLAQGSLRFENKVSDDVGAAAANEMMVGNLKLQFDDLVAVQAVPQTQETSTQMAGHQTVWVRRLDEKQVTLDSVVNVSRDFDEIRFQNLKLVSSTLNVAASGSLSDVRDSLRADIAGTWQPQWDRLQPLLEAYVGQTVSLGGVTGGSFRLQGPLLPTTSAAWVDPQLEFHTDLAWQQGQVLGLPIGGSQMKVNLRQGFAELQVSAMPVAGGVLNLAPRVDLRGPDLRIELPPGRVIDRVQLTPEICRGWLKFVAPMVAEVTAVQGQFTVDATHTQYFPANMAATRLAGQLALHGGQIGPGPLGQKLVGLIQQVKLLAQGQPLQFIGGGSQAGGEDWMMLPEQQIPFEMRDGRVFHDGLMIQVDGVTLKTSGSVGMDQSLQLVALVPIADKWLGTQPWLAGLRGQTLQIPIAGTVSSPKIDQSALVQISQQLLQQAAGSAIQDQIQQKTQGLFDKANEKIGNELLKGINGLFGPKK